MQPGEVASTGAGQNTKGRMAELLRRASTARRVDDGKGPWPSEALCGGLHVFAWDITVTALTTSNVIHCRVQVVKSALDGNTSMNTFFFS